MAKDLTKMTTEKLWRRARAALDELERRTAQANAEPRRDAPPMTERARPKGRHIPATDPVLLDVWNRTPLRPDTPQDVRMEPKPDEG